MKHASPKCIPVVLVALFAAAVTALAWQNKPQAPRELSQNLRNGDTTEPRKRHRSEDEFRIKDLDEALRQLDVELARMHRLQTTDLLKMEKELKAALAELDAEKIRRQVERSVSEVDWTSIEKDMQRAMKAARQAVEKVDSKRIEAELLRAREELRRIDMEQVRLSAEEGMKQAREGLARAKEELARVREMTDEMEKDGLIKKGEKVNIEMRQDDLYINGVKQPKQVSDKYRKWMKRRTEVI